MNQSVDCMGRASINVHQTQLSHFKSLEVAMSVSMPPGAKDPTLTLVPASSTESARMRVLT